MITEPSTVLDEQLYLILVEVSNKIFVFVLSIIFRFIGGFRPFFGIRVGNGCSQALFVLVRIVSINSSLDVSFTTHVR
jgi:hypothetical protein